MAYFLGRRFALGILSLVAATAIVFALSRAAGDPRLLFVKPGGYAMTKETYEAIGKKLGLDKPLPVQYLIWIGRVTRGDLGRTVIGELPVADLVKSRLGATIQLSVGAWFVATIIGVPLGVLSAVKRGSVFDYFGRFLAVIGSSLPSFWIGVMLILFFAVTLDWLPVAGRGPTGSSFPDNWKYFVLPIFTLGFTSAAPYLRLTRSAMLDVMDSEYVKLARAKGVDTKTVIWKHGLRNALISPLTYSGLLLAGFLSGATVVETVFAWPGIGRLATDAVYQNDYPMITGAVLIFAVLFVIASYVLDILYAFVDPRIRFVR
ncbi:MAG: ABC transporter permease [Chloroflexi bacterium]|nr:ABC transporter permease [Chloroflexota bacterium]